MLIPDLALQLLTSVTEVDPTKGELVWMAPFYIFISFGLFGLFAMMYSRGEPRYIRPFILAAGTGSVLLQYGCFTVEMLKYPESFGIYDALVMPLHLLILPQCWGSLGTIILLVIPSLGTIASTLLIPVLWSEYRGYIAKKSPSGKADESSPSA